MGQQHRERRKQEKKLSQRLSLSRIPLLFPQNPAEQAEASRIQGQWIENEFGELRHKPTKAESRRRAIRQAFCIQPIHVDLAEAEEALVARSSALALESIYAIEDANACASLTNRCRY